MLLDRHLAFVRALRGAGVPVSLVEDLDAVAAVDRLGLADREGLRAGLAAALVKSQVHRPAFDALFDLWFPPLLGGGVAGVGGREDRVGEGRPPLAEVDAWRERLLAALLADDAAALHALAVEGVGRFGIVPGRRPGSGGAAPPAWSSYTTMQRVDADALVRRLAAALHTPGQDRAPRSRPLADAAASARVARFRRQVETEVRRRTAEDRTPELVARTTLRPPIDRLDFLAARREEVEEMRRQLQPLARRLATRLARERRSRHRGPLAVRRTVRASMSTGGVPFTTWHRPRRPHRSDLVVLCDVSGSVAHFASFTLALVFALREQFSRVRAFTFVDDVHEVSAELRVDADPQEVLARVIASARHASLWGRTDYGRALVAFQDRYGDALGPQAALLVLGDARSNYADPRAAVLADLVASCRHAWWLNPEHRRQWDTGDSAASAYAAVLPMVECRNLVQLGEFVHDVVRG